MIIDGQDFTLYQPYIFEKLRDGAKDGTTDQIAGPEWFRTAMAVSFEQIARGFGCQILLSPERLSESRRYWIEDCGRIDIDGGTDPDHFKLAGFLCYWLRRRIVTYHVARTPDAEQTDRQTAFAQYGNEICSFLIGFRLCNYFASKSIIDSAESVQDEFQELDVPEGLLRDIYILLRHKNVSPHSIYLIYRSLFETLRPTR